MNMRHRLIILLSFIDLAEARTVSCYHLHST